MQNLDRLSREELLRYLKFTSNLAMALDGLWFMAAESATDYEHALAMDINVWKGYAPLVVKRVRKHFHVEGRGLAALKEVMSHDPLWWAMEVAVLEDSAARLVFEVRRCPALAAMERMGRERLTCEPVELAYLEALALAVDPAIKVEALKLPPRHSPDEVCCRWAFRVE